MLDSFVGSGSTLLAAQREQRRGYGCDIDPAAIAEAMLRFESGGDS